MAKTLMEIEKEVKNLSKFFGESKNVEKIGISKFYGMFKDIGRKIKREGKTSVDMVREIREE